MLLWGDEETVVVGGEEDGRREVASNGCLKQ